MKHRVLKCWNHSRLVFAGVAVVYLDNARSQNVEVRLKLFVPTVRLRNKDTRFAKPTVKTSLFFRPLPYSRLNCIRKNFFLLNPAHCAQPLAMEKESSAPNVFCSSRSVCDIYF